MQKIAHIRNWVADIRSGVKRCVERKDHMRPLEVELLLGDLETLVGYIEGRNDCQEIVGELGDMGHPSVRDME